MESTIIAERAVLAYVFRRYPDHFVWTGGSVLQLLHQSPRSSLDLDLVPLLPLTGRDLSGSDLLTVVGEALQVLAPLMNLRFETRIEEERPDFLRIRVEGAEPGLGFTLDVTSMPGRAASTEVILLDSVLGAASVVVSSPGSQLAQKWRALFLRRFAKPGDLFDVWFLLNQGAALFPNEQTALRDELAAAEVDVLERLGTFDRGGWQRALVKSGVDWLTPEAGRLMLDQVRQAAAAL